MVALNGSSRLGITESITMLGPDFPFAYDEWLSQRARPGRNSRRRVRAPVAVVGGGLSGPGHRVRTDAHWACARSVYEAGQSAGGCARRPSTPNPRRSPSSAPCASRASATALLPLPGPGRASTPGRSRTRSTPATPQHRRRPERRAALRQALRRPPRRLPGSRHAWDKTLQEHAELFADGRRDPPPGHRDHQGIWNRARPRPRRPVLLRLPRELAVLRLLPAPRDLRPGRLRRRRLGHRLPQLHAGDPAGRLHRRRGRAPAARRRLPSSCPSGSGRTRPTASRTGPRAPRWSPCTTAAPAAPRPASSAPRADRRARQDGAARAFPGGRLHAAQADAGHPRSAATGRCCPRPRVDRGGAHPLHGLAPSCSFWSTGPSGATSTHAPAAR